MGKLLIILGVLFILAGLLFIYFGQIPFLGRLPGDISIKGDNYQFYFPIVTCLVISLLLSLLFYFFR